MRRVTLLLSGVPQYVTLRDLSYNLDLLFNTDEIETFKIRDLPNHPQTNKRQIALDFRSGYDAMAAQEKLEGYTYELDNGREYTLHAKINKLEEYMCSETPEYDGSHRYGDDWMALAMIPNVSDRDMYRAHARLDAQLGLLKKQKLVLEKEKELLNEKQRLKRKYGSMVSSLYEVTTPWAQPSYNVEQACESETEVSPPKISRSTSRDRWSKSRELRPHRGSRRSRSKDSGYVLPQIEWNDERTKTRVLRSQSRERQRSSANSRDRRSSSRGNRYPRHREQRSRSSDKDRYRRSTSRERGVRARSRSKERFTRSRESMSKEHRSRSKERRSRSREQMNYRRSRSRDRTRHDARVSRSDWDRRGRRLRSPDRRTNQLAIMPRTPRANSPSEWSVDYLKAFTPTGNTKHKADITNKQVHIKVEKDANHTAKEADTKENKSDTKIKEKGRKKNDKYKTKSIVQALSKDIMILIAIIVDEIIDRDKIRISALNKITLIKVIDASVQERLEAIAVQNNDNKEVLKKYKMKYPMEGDLRMIKQMLLEMKVHEATVTVCSEKDKSNVSDDILDVDRAPTKQECTTANLTPGSTDNASQIKQEPAEEPIIIIDIDSAEKPVPRRPQFIFVIKALVKNMAKVIRTNKLGEEIKFAELKLVLRHILRDMLKGQGYFPSKEILRKFREVYPVENDERFVRNAIKDIKDGKYPELTGHIVEIETPVPENDNPDDVILIEKKYDVVTVSDSDDDDMYIEPEQHTEEQITEVIKLDSESPQAKPNSNRSQPVPGPSNMHIKTDPVNPEQTNPGSTSSGQDKPCSNTVQATHLDIPGEAQTSPPDPAQAMAALANTSQANIDANPCQSKTAAKPGLVMPDPSSPVRANTGLPSQAQTRSVNPDQARTDVPNASQANTSFADLNLALPYHVNASQAKQGPYTLGQAKTDPGNAEKHPNNVSQAMMGPGNPSQAKIGPGNPGQAKKCPNNVGQTISGLGNAKKGPNNPSQAKMGPGIPGQVKKGPNNAGQANKGPIDPSQINSGSGIPGQAMTVPGNPGQAKKDTYNLSEANTGPNNPGQAKTTPVNTNQVTAGFANLSQAKTCPISSQAASNKDNQKKSSLDNTIQNLESLDDSEVVVISSPNGKAACRKRRKRGRKRKRAGKVQETPAKDKNSPIEDSKDKVKINAFEDNDNNLKVTAITIVTSLNELIAKSKAKETEVEVPNEIKKEIEIEEEKLDESSLTLPDGPRVTSITIMTSDAELFSLGQEDRKEVNEIKNETDVFYDAEDNLVNDIERAFDDVNFGKSIMSEHIAQSSVNSEQFSGVHNSEQFSSVTNSEQFSSVNNSEQFSSKTASVPQASRTGQDEEETIESIVKYVASMY